MNPIDLKKEFPPTSIGAWRTAAEALLKGAPFDKVLRTRTYEEITLEPIYTLDDRSPLTERLPGQPPFLRGVHAGGYLTRPWQIAQRMYESDPGKYNLALKQTLASGQNTIFLNFGGENGLEINSSLDLQTALNGIDLTSHPILIDPGEHGAAALPLFAAFCRQSGMTPDKLSVSILYDPFKNALLTGRLNPSNKQTLKPAADSIKWCIDHAPAWQVLAVDASLYTDAGASAVQELAWGMATAVEYLKSLPDYNLPIDRVAPGLRFCFGLGSHFFMEIAKLRAARVLWRQIVTAFGGSDESAKIKMHARTASLNKSWLDPHVNMLRTTTEAFSGVMGGVDSLEIAPFDEIYTTPDAFSRRIARNTHIILRDEAHLDRVIDPAGGSWYIEWLTGQIAQKSWQLFQQVQAQGGMFRALQNGNIQEQASETLQKRVDNAAHRKDRQVGVNMYANDQEKLRMPPDIISQKEAASYDIHKIGELREAIANSDNPIETLTGKGLDCDLATLARAMQAEADFVEIPPLDFRRVAQPFEALRAAVDSYNKLHSAALSVLLINFGNVSQYKPREEFAAAFFRTAGFTILSGDTQNSVAGAWSVVEQNKAAIVVICSADALYPEFVPDLTRKIKDHSPDKIVILAGYPKEQIELYRTAGVDEFIHLGCNTLLILQDLLKRLEVLA